MTKREERQELENLMVTALIKGLAEIFNGDMEMVRMSLTVLSVELLGFDTHEAMMRVATDMLEAKFAQSKN